MKRLYFLFFIVSFSLGFTQTKQTINGIQFEFFYTKDTLNDYPRDIVTVYRKNKKLFTHTIHITEGDCSSENLELGTYEINGNQIIFYSYWASGDRMGVNIFPFGFRKQVYTVDKKGIVSLTQAQFYIETDVRGSKLLRKKSLSKKEKSELGVYKELLEYRYLSKFAEGKEKDILEQEVRLKLKEAIEDHTKDWEEVYVNFNR